MAPTHRPRWWPRRASGYSWPHPRAARSRDYDRLGRESERRLALWQVRYPSALRRLPMVLAAARAEWARAAQTSASVLRELAGTPDEVLPWSELGAAVSPSPDAPTCSARVAPNVLRFRPNYARLAGAWLLVCAIRHPFKTIWVLLVLAGWFHALIVRRGVVHVVLPSSGGAAGKHVATLMRQQLWATLAFTSLFALWLVGCAWWLAGVVLTPLCACLVHAALCRSPERGKEAMLEELRHRLRRALHDKEVDADEIETGEPDGGGAPPVRDDEMSRRVEQIRNKYRPPGGTRKDVRD